MPDGTMTPEFPSVPTDPPGAMRGPDFFPKSGEYMNFDIKADGTENEDNNEDREYQQRQFFREGQTQVEILEKSRDNKQLVDASRTLISAFEDMSLHPDGTSSEYRLDDVITMVGNRSADMGYDINTLAALGYFEITTYNPETTEAVFQYPGFSFSSGMKMDKGPKKEIFDGDGNLIRTEIESVPTQTFFVGTDKQRIELSGNLHTVQAEMTAREDLVKMLRWVWNQTENLEGLVEFYFKGSLTAEAMEILCNATARKGRTSKDGSMEQLWSSLKKTEGGVDYREGHEFGDAISVSIKCFEINALSEKPNKLEKLLKRPGTREMFNVTDQSIDDLFLAPQDRENRPLDKKLVKWIGEPWKWSKVINGPKENVSEEISSRGELTKQGNVLVESSWDDVEDLFEQINRFLGGGKGSKSLVKMDAKDAVFVGWGLFRTTGEASELGGQQYKVTCVDGVERVITHHEMGGMTSCDRVKVFSPGTFAYIYKYIKPEVRPFGPDGSVREIKSVRDETPKDFANRGRYLDEYPDRFTVPYFKAWVGKTANGKRTFQEMRWGYRTSEEVDLLKGSKVALPEEKYYRLGELPWRKLSPKAYNGAALGPFIAGRKEVGLFQYRVNTKWRLDELKDDTFAKKFAANMGISMNFQTVFDGVGRGVYNGDPSHDNSVELKTKVKDKIRDYKKKYLRAFWNGIRSLPQYKEWCAIKTDTVSDTKTGSNLQADPIDRIKYRLGRIHILTPEEAMALPDSALNKDLHA